MALFQGFAAEVVEKLVVTPTIDQTSLEQYRRLAATLHLSQGSRRLKVVMIASALPYEGKTLTASNLALTLSESYRRRVLLVDADLRRPTLHEMFGLPNGPGLNDMLHATDDEKVPVIQVSPFLYVLTGGRPDADPMSMLTSDRMRRVLQEAAAKFDWVILDTPPVGLMTDAGLLAAMADAVALVVHAARTACPSIQRAIEAVGRQRVLGIVLNRVDKRVLRDAYRLGEYTSRYAQPNGIPA
jgi:protein-tyrosine kinase